MITDNAALRQFLMLFFNDDELEDFCLDYFADVAQEFTIGMTKSQKVRLLIGHGDRRGRREHLLAALAKERPDQYVAELGRAPAPAIAPSAVAARDPRRVFISHAHQDSATAHQLAADLIAAGRPVWIAPESVLPGEQWVEAIGRGLEMSGVFLLLLSPEAVASNWVRYETSLAIVLEKRGRMNLIPLDWQPCEPPLTWQGYHYLPFRNFGDGLTALLASLDGRALPVTPPRPRVEIVTPAPPLPSPPAPLPNRRIHAKTGIELIRIPAGPFIYGEGKEQKTIDLPEYWIGRAPVTNAEFTRFIQATGHKTTAEIEGIGYGWTGSKWEWIKDADWRHPRGPESSIQGKDEHPVVQVSWDDAKAFCDWAGLILPIEEQWEKAARGNDGHIWPWGNEPPTAEQCNFNMNVKDTTPVGRYSPRGDSPYACVDTAGNVWEWTESWYKGRSKRALRGGSWYNNAQLSRVAYRYSYNPFNRNNYVGFRVVELLSVPGS
ncbi:SUMF1/EgtB/PvdO family nonheme iron enzyme [Candidatus Promineifilum breve]|nr:SUMF1/EgtB/PvdO family nonheme iron enzyme [Candidatus Promineifilum breve]